MDGRFMEIQQAMGTPKGRTAGAAYLRAFVEDDEGLGICRRGAQAQQPARRQSRRRRSEAWLVSEDLASETWLGRGPIKA